MQYHESPDRIGRANYCFLSFGDRLLIEGAFFASPSLAHPGRHTKQKGK